MTFDKALLVTNEASLSGQLTHLLNNEIDISIASNQDQALARLHSATFKLVLLDVATRGVIAYELCRLVKKDPDLGSLSVIFLYSNPIAFDAQEAKKCGGDDWLQLPFLDEDHARFRILQKVSVRQAQRYIKAMTPESVSIIDLMSHRAAAILESLLLEDQRIAPGVSREEFEEKIEGIWREKLGSLATNEKFAQNLARRCLDQMPRLIWTEAAERLIDSHHCKIDDFGNLTVTRQYNELKATLDAKRVFMAKRVPQMFYKGVRPAFEVAMKVCYEQGGGPLQKFLNAPASVPIVINSEAVDLLGTLIPLSLSAFNSQNDVRGPGSAPNGSDGQLKSWLGNQGLMLAHLVYYAYFANIRRIVQTEEVTMGTLGTLRLQGSLLVWNLSDYMKRLINAFWPMELTAASG